MLGRWGSSSAHDLTEIHPMAAVARLVALTLASSAWAGAVSNSTCLLQRNLGAALVMSLLLLTSSLKGMIGTP